MFIVIEGPDKAGKTTVAERLSTLLSVPHFQELKENGSIRRMLNNSELRISNLGEEQFKINLTQKFMKNRLKYHPLLSEMLKWYGGTIIDRYSLSTRLYGTFIKKEEIEIHDKSIIQPDLTIILISSKEDIIDRCKGEDGDYFEDPEKIIKMRKKFIKFYESLKKREKEKYLIVYVNELEDSTIEGVTNYILEELKKYERKGLDG